MARIDSKLNSKSLTGSQTNVTFERGSIDLEPGRKMLAAVLKMTIPVQNSTGGALALSDANRQLLLSLFLINVTCGAKSMILQQPYQNVDFRRIHTIARECFNKEVKGYADAVNGLATSMANNATTNEVLYLPVPLGQAWWLRGDYRDMWGCGRSQSKLIEIFIKQTGTAIAAGWAINGNVSIELEPYCVDSAADVWSPLPVYEEKDEVNKRLELPGGLPLSLHERTQPQASDPLTGVSLSIGNHKVFQLLAAADRAFQFEMAQGLTASGYPSDRETVIYEVTDGEVSFEDSWSGAPTLVQDIKDLATFKAAYFYVPVLDPEKLTKHVDYVAKNIAHSNVKFVSMADATGMKVPDELRPYVPYNIYREGDVEFEKFAGMAGFTDDTMPRVAVPKSMLARSKRLVADLTEHKEVAAAADVAKRVAVAVPGAVEDTAGLKKGNSAVLNTVRRMVG